MKILSREELGILTESPGNPAVYVYMPAHRTGDIEQDPIGLKNLLQEAEGQLVDYGLRVSDARGFLRQPSNCYLIRIPGGTRVMVWLFSCRPSYFDTIGFLTDSRGC